jgi:hypothetical protein
VKPIVITGRRIEPNETVKRLNPHLFGLGAVANPKRQQHQRSEGQDRELAQGPDRLGCRYIITIVSLRRRLCDGHDNLRTGAKPLVDAITSSLGFPSDDHPRLEWHYHQLKTTGQEGTAVKVDEVKP